MATRGSFSGGKAAGA